MQELTIVTSEPDALFGVGGIHQVGPTVSATMEPRPILGADGRAAVGALGVLADNTLGYAVMAALPQGAWSISTEIWIDVIEPLDVRRPVVRGTAEVHHGGGLSQGALLDAEGRVVAECRQRGREVEPVAPGSGARSSIQPAAEEPVDLGELVGVRRVADRHVLEVEPILLNPRDMLHGGISLAASEFAATASRVEAGSTLATSSVHIVHTRGVPRDATITFESITRHSGRTLWVTEVVGRVDGKVATVTTVTAG
ncbi:hypothetical protein ASG90_01715 [Nocardioides sp. Soil797]|nr:hypothetical protein ASG90_01715 [Nocardioides sp. Soil797]